MRVQTAPSVLAPVRELIDPPLSSAVDRFCPESRLVCGYHLGLHDADGKPVASRGGNALRPALVLLSPRAAAGCADDVLDGAVAVEIVHNWSILHDDVIDRDQRRGHQPTARTIFGEQRAILAADALLNLAWQEFVDSSSPVRTEALRRLNRAVGLVDDLASFGWHLGLAFQEAQRSAAVGDRPHGAGDSTDPTGPGDAADSRRRPRGAAGDCSLCHQPGRVRALTPHRSPTVGQGGPGPPQTAHSTVPG